ncbi:unnamed protein product [Linum trigynum]|uniref:Reverse transcriptase n=1 Tax=Linum trigynum TaxID=586398 RepID=A0AAV2DY22_9ROSI
MSAFRDWITEMELIDHQASSSFFTWTNQQSGNPIARKLDRILVNVDWLDGFPDSVAEFLNPSFSDHCGMLVRPSRPRKSFPKPFRFFEMWMQHPSYDVTVTEVWNQQLQGPVLQRIKRKFQMLKIELKKLNRQEFMNISDKVKAANSNLELAQAQALEDPTPVTFERMHLLTEELQYLRRAEECFYRQKSCINWLALGDMNLAFFHKAVKIRQACKQLRRLISNSGAEITNEEEIVEEAVGFYKNMYGIVNPEVKLDSTVIGSFIRKQVSEQSKHVLCAEVTNEEVRVALFAMDPLKAPGPDGWT